MIAILIAAQVSEQASQSILPASRLGKRREQVLYQDVPFGLVASLV
jgi:hypothetical protein